MIRLLLIRHAATAASEKNLLLGSTDSEASQPGLSQVERLPGLIKAHDPEVLYCSPMRRTVQTAEKLAGLGSCADGFLQDARLREIDFGRWEQKSFVEIEASDPELIPAWSRYKGFVFPEGEAVDDFVARITSVLDDFHAKEEKVIGVVTHGGVIRTMICLALGLDPRNYLLFNVAPASLTILDLYPDGGILTGLNL